MKQDFNKALDQKDWNNRLDEVYDDQRLIDGIVTPIVSELRKPNDGIRIDNIEDIVTPIVSALKQDKEENKQELQVIKDGQSGLLKTLQDGLRDLLRRDNDKAVSNSIDKQTKTLEALRKSLERQEKAVRGIKLPEIEKEEKSEELADMVELLKKIEKDLRGSKGSGPVLTTPKIQDQFQRSNGERVAALVDSDNHLQVDIQTMPTATEQEALSLYGLNDIVVSGSITYLGKEKADGTWCVQEIDTTSGTVFRYATVGNNPAYTTYATAFAARASLTYDYYSEVF